MNPETVGRYEIQGLLGEGAFGQVFAANDPVLGRAVAIKVLRTIYSNDASFMERFRTEAASLAALAHPNITAIYDLLQSGPHHGMIMELVLGHTLEHVLSLKRRLEPRQALAIVAQAAAGLGYVHRCGVVHRDIKPANIMVTAEGVLKIMDFGIARIEGTKRLTRDGSVVGTLAYAAPEQIKTGAGEPRSDQYSLACMLYEMLSGNPPFDAASEYELMQAQIAQPPEPATKLVPGLPVEIDRALLRALAKSPAERFDSVEEFARALGAEAVQLQATGIVGELVTSAGPVTALPRRALARRPSPLPSSPSATAQPPAPLPPTRSSPLRPLLAMAAAVAVAFAVGGYIFFDSRGPTQPFSSVAVAERTPTSSDEVAPAVNIPPKAPAAGILAKVSEPAKPTEALPEARPTESQASALPVGPRIESRPTEPRPAEAQSVEPRAAAAQESPKLDRPPPFSPDVPPARRFDDTDGPAKPKFAMSAGGEKTSVVPPNPALPKLDQQPIPKATVPPVEERQAARPAAKPGEVAPAMPTGPPNYRGRVLNWPSGGTIRVRATTGTVPEFFKLFGVRDLRSANKQSAADAVFDKLETFFAASGREATCWKRYSSEFQDTRYLCFIAGQDIGLWAIENGLAESTNDAPAHYRQAAQR
jgi:serine/threonine protein kinase